MDPEGLLNYPPYARIFPRITSSFSLIGSALIAYDLVKRKRLAKVHHRILFGMSLADMISSICTALGRIPVVRGDDVFPGYGTTMTCTAQGFFYQTTLAVLSYNLCLAVYYVLLVRYNWTDQHIARYEWVMHGTSMAVFLGSATTLASLRMFNPDYFLCFIQSSPAGCVEDCDRGGHPSEYRWAFFYGPAWTMIVCITGLMLLLYGTVWKQERRMDRFRFGASTTPSNENLEVRAKAQQQPATQDRSETHSTSENPAPPEVTSPRQTTSSVDRKKTANASSSHVLSRRVAIQGVLYTVPFYVTWIFPLTAHALGPTWIGQHGRPLLILVAIFLPLQGLGNALVYALPMVLQRMEQRKRRQGSTTTTTVTCRATTAAPSTPPPPARSTARVPIRRDEIHV